MMLVGALFLGLNVAPTEEMVQIAWTMTPWHALGLVALTVATMHAFVYGHGAGDGDAPWWSLMLRFTLVGYALALAMSLYALWTFGRIDGVGGAPLADGDAGARLPGRARRRRRPADPLRRRWRGGRGIRPPNGSNGRSGSPAACWCWRSAGYLAWEGLSAGRHAAAPLGDDGAGAAGELRFTVRNDGGRTATAVALSLRLGDGGRAAPGHRLPARPLRGLGRLRAARGRRAGRRRSSSRAISTPDRRSDQAPRAFGWAAA